MAKVKIYPVVVFTKDYAGKKTGETLKCGRQLAAELVTAGVATYEDKPAELPPAEKKPVETKVINKTKSKK